jgi:hypothetical protein
MGDLFDQLAEAVVPPAAGADGDSVDRRARVAEARERLKAKRPELEKGITKVRRLQGK